MYAERFGTGYDNVITFRESRLVNCSILVLGL